MNCPPILFLVFNRPVLTQRVFFRIREVRPAQLFVAADGPRTDRPFEAELCAEARNVINKIDWPCDVNTLFREQNLGCKNAVSEAISWFFMNVEDGIILEDDCLPDMSFFYFCGELLERYKDDSRIGIISGDLFLKDQILKNSYYFSNFPHLWGWASWRRSWQNYDVTTKDWPQIRNLNWLIERSGSKYYARKWLTIFNKVYQQEIDTWDYQVVFMLWVQNQFSIVPNHNLVSNIGFGVDSTHTPNPSDRFSLMTAEKMIFPLVHPQSIIRDKENDLLEELYIFGAKRTLLYKIIYIIKLAIRKLINGMPDGYRIF